MNATETAADSSVGRAELPTVLTTGDVARVLGISPRSAAKLIDEELLAGYRLPGMRNRQVSRVAFEKFCQANGIPLAELVSAWPPAATSGGLN